MHRISSNSRSNAKLLVLLWYYYNNNYVRNGEGLQVIAFFRINISPPSALDRMKPSYPASLALTSAAVALVIISFHSHFQSPPLSDLWRQFSLAGAITPLLNIHICRSCPNRAIAAISRCILCNLVTEVEAPDHFEELLIPHSTRTSPSHGESGNIRSRGSADILGSRGPEA